MLQNLHTDLEVRVAHLRSGVVARKRRRDNFHMIENNYLYIYIYCKNLPNEYTVQSLC